MVEKKCEICIKTRRVYKSQKTGKFRCDSCISAEGIRKRGMAGELLLCEVCGERGPHVHKEKITGKLRCDKCLRNEGLAKRGETNYSIHKEWRKKNPVGRNRERKKNYKRNTDVYHNVRNGGEEWTEHEDERILSQDRPKDRDLSRELGRSVQAIQGKRSKLLKNSQSDKLSLEA